MVLGYESILKRIREANLIENFSDASLNGAGYDLRLGGVYDVVRPGSILKSSQKKPEIAKRSGDVYIIKPDHYVLVETIEKINMPYDLIARVLPRSTLFRCGCSLETAVVDPGYSGILTFGLKNNTGSEFEMETGARIAQIVFEKVSGRTIPYNGRYQGGRIV